MPKKQKGKKKDDDWNDEDVEKKLEEKIKNLSTDDKEEENVEEKNKGKSKKVKNYYLII